jgi:hypothetical protein
MDTSTGAVPVGPALTTVELGNGKGAELDRMVEVFGDPVPETVDEVRPPVPPLPVGAMVLEFDSGNGALLVGMPGTLPVPRSPVLRGTDVPIHDDGAVGPPVTVWFVRGYGTEVLLEMTGAVEIPVPELRKEDDAEPAIVDALVALGKGNGAGPELVTRLVGAVTPPVVGKAQVLEFVRGKGADVEDLLGVQVGTPVPEDGSCPLEVPVPPVGPAKLELLEGKGGSRLVLDTADETGPVPSPELPVGPAVGPAADEELLIGNGGVCNEELAGGPCTLVPNGAVPVPRAKLVELEIGNGAELDPVAEIGVPDVRTPVPLTGPVAGPVPVGPT